MTGSDDTLAARLGGALALAVVAGATLLQAGRLRRALQAARGLVADTTAFTQRPHGPRQRVLLLGDSTGVGVGGGPAHSVAALLARDHPQLQLINACRSGARLPDVAQQVAAHAHELPHMDAVLVLAGGNDVLYTRRLPQLERAADALMRVLAPVAPRVVWLGPANIGHAPVFVPPFSWWMSLRTRQAARIYARCARRAGATYLDFFRVGAADPFVADRQRWFARDGIHPSAASYRYCYDRLRRSAPFSRLLPASGALKARVTAAG
ncbi:GDSL-type esterase/lipase family protein [Aquincola sp. J276]|uniref:SGNH/GDSL hydrolase family protein n=1 Tax=Aquincola sp. J276 TaxID=2898432 RepID=UPI0021510740|nr:GDSL-type esterase/lipase family protein [Aquincola sp. J276]MCR5868585.1 GDSL-type esterase/lipase family protein [Aquincola sp. J276]